MEPGAGVYSLMDLALSMALGATCGLALGVTGGGGAMLAIPLLVYVLSTDPAEAVTISLMAVGVAALIGLAQRIRSSEIDYRAAFFLGAGGVIAAPFGSWLCDFFPPQLLLSLFGLLAATVSIKMWRNARSTTEITPGPCAARKFSSRCFFVLTGAGLATGVLSGLFGIGGGLVIVPALIFATGMSMHRAVPTSLLIIFLVSMSALIAALASGRAVTWGIALPFFVGSVAGMVAGTGVRQRVSGPALTQSFAGLLAIIAVWIIGESLLA